MDERRRTKLSKFLALLLRHEADRHGLRLDPEGFVPLAELVAAIQRAPGWAWVGAAEVEDVVAHQQKRRYEIVGGDIRAVYGHSLEAAVGYPRVEPPAELLHGTARRTVDAILAEGLRPMGRQYVHMTDDLALALLTGRRRDPHPAVIRIAAARAAADGVAFFRADDGVFLAAHIPPAYLAAADAGEQQ